MADFRVRVRGLGRLSVVLRGLGPSFEQRVYAPALGAMAAVVRKRAKKRDYGFEDGTEVRPFDRARGRDSSVRLRSTIRSRRIPAFYSGRRYKSGRAAVFAGGPGARHAHLVERGHGGPRPARPHPFLTRALIETQQLAYTEFVNTARRRFPIAVAQAMRRGSGGAGSVFGRTFARRRR